MTTEHEAVDVQAPSDTPITITLPLGAWHRVADILRKAPYEAVVDILPELIAQADPQVIAAARDSGSTGKLATRIVSKAN